MGSVVVTVDPSVMPAHPDVERAVRAVWRRRGRRRFKVELDYRTGQWTPQEFEDVFGGEYEFDADHALRYHPLGHEGRIAELVSRQTGNLIRYKDVDPLEEGTVA